MGSVRSMSQALSQLRNQLSRLMRVVLYNAIRLMIVGLVSLFVAIAMSLTFVNLTIANQFDCGISIAEPVALAEFDFSTKPLLSITHLVSVTCEHSAVETNSGSNKIKLTIASPLYKNNKISKEYLQLTNNLLNLSVNENNNLETTEQIVQILDDYSQIDIWSKLVIFLSRSNLTITEPISVPNLITKQNWIYKNPTIYHFT